MRRTFSLALGLLFASTAVSGARAQTSGADPYRIVGEVAVQHGGRIKPLDTFARQMVKQVYTREIIKLKDLDGNEVGRWEPLPAFLDWQARPEFWNDQEIIAVEYPPLRTLVFEQRAREALKELADSGKLSADDKARVEKAASEKEIAWSDLKAASALPGVPDALKARLKTIAHKIHPDQKWLSSNDLDEAEVKVDGREVPFREWLASLYRRQAEAEESSPELSPMEKKALEASMKMALYQGLRDGNPRGVPMMDLYLVPRPADATYLKYLGAAFKKVLERDPKAAEPVQPTSLERNSIQVVESYLEDIKTRDYRLPGADAEFDARLAEWLREKSAWVPLRVLKETKPEELTRAGFDAEKVQRLIDEYGRAIENEKEHPKGLNIAAATGLYKAARDLGESTPVAFLLRKDVKHKTWSDLDPARVSAFTKVRDPLASSSKPLSDEDRSRLIESARGLSGEMIPYPPRAEMQREVAFNHFAPFYKAPMAYGAAVVLLMISLGVAGVTGRSSLVHRVIYGLGLLGFVSGIGLEIIGFYYRVRISGWAPVTNMYETVIWVALVCSVIGLVMEAIYRKTYPALAASSGALIATVLAANVSLLDPNIGSLMPVLRSNFWLTIHVLTIVSSYAAFALSMMLALVAIGFYLSATYRRDVPYAKLAQPLAVSLPMLAIGVGGLIYAYSRGTSSPPAALTAFALGTLSIFGMMGTIIGGFGLIGELANRASKKALALGVVLTVLGAGGVFGARSLSSPSWWPDTLSLLAPPAIVMGLGVTVILLSFLGASARAAMVIAASRQAAHGSGEAEADVAVDFAEPMESFRAAHAGGGTATLKKPSVAEIRARENSHRKDLDPRGQAMQATAARIKPLANFVYRAMQVGVLLVAAGTILGGVWADFSWGRFWGWDAKEVWALITLLVYLVPLHGRFAGWVNTFVLTCASVACFASVLMAWYGVNFVLNTGLHSYGFVEGGGQGVVLSSSLAVLAIVGAAAWRRHLASAPVA